MVNEHNGNAAGNDSANNNPGFRVPDGVRDLIVETFLTLRGEGDRTKGPSAKAVDARIRSEYPGIEGSIPSLQTINSILKPLRDAESDDPLDRPWSLSLWMQDPHDINREDLHNLEIISNNLEINSSNTQKHFEPISLLACLICRSFIGARYQSDLLAHVVNPSAIHLIFILGLCKFFL
mgnify:CR=1 FL=1